MTISFIGHLETSRLACWRLFESPV